MRLVSPGPLADFCCLLASQSLAGLPLWCGREGLPRGDRRPECHSITWQARGLLLPCSPYLYKRDRVRSGVSSRALWGFRGMSREITKKPPIGGV